MRMNGIEQTVSYEILQQAQFQYLVVLFPVAVVFVLGVIFSVASIKFGVSQKVCGLIGTVVFISLVSFGIWYAMSSKGSIEVAADRLLVNPRLRGLIEMKMPPESYAFKIWLTKSASLIQHRAGPMLVLTNGRQTLTIACLNPEVLKSTPASDQWEETVMPPQFVISWDDFTDLVDRIGLKWTSY
jgi:hypothetical protein